MMKNIFLFSILLGFNILCMAQGRYVYKTIEPPQEPDKCFAKYILYQEIIKVEDKIVPIYRGVDMAKNPFVKKVALCTVSDPRTPKNKSYHYFDVVTNTLEEQNYEDMTFHVVQYSKEVNPSAEWHEVVCENKINTSLATRIHIELKKKHFTTGDYIDMSTLKAALYRYEIQQEIPVTANGESYLQVETMKRLGILY